MKILITTQSVDMDNSYLAFFHSWITEYAKYYERVTVISLEEGRHSLPPNVRVISLGKEKRKTYSGLFDRIAYSLAFYRHIIRERKEYDRVFVHMNPIYVVLGGLPWKIMGKKIFLWYTHRNVDMKLRIAEKLCDRIFTASLESFQLDSTKVEIIGHGIDVNAYVRVVRTKEIGTEPVRIIHAGRITEIKNFETLVRAALILKKTWQKKFEILLVGAPVTEQDEVYAKKLRNFIDESGLNGEIRFVGRVLNADMPQQYASTDISVNLAPTGGVDKSVLESMAAGVPVLASNKTYERYFGVYAESLLFLENDAKDLASKIIALFSSGDIQAVTKDLQRIAKERADLPVLIRNMVEKMK
ncbi:MAG: glycosyltransferase family 4 protein [Candidatus Paceibacterota bacterium]